MTSDDYERNGDLFILGAGSSKPYGLPLGSELLQLIKNFESFVSPFFDDQRNGYQSSLFHNYHGAHESFQDIKFKTWNEHLEIGKDYISHFEKIKKDSYLLLCALSTSPFPVTRLDIISFFKLLNESGVLTIDTFVSNLGYGVNQDEHTVAKYKDLGRILIGFHINCLFEESGKSDWIEYFMHEQIAYRSKEFVECHPSVITFNYDTLFESKISNFLKLQGGAKKDFRLEPTHVYGKIEKQKVENKEDMNKAIIHWKDGIKTIQRGTPDESLSEDIEKIRNEIKNAKRIFILGYGFDRFNNKILFGNDLDLIQLIESEVEIYITGFGVQPALLNKLNQLSLIDECMHFDEVDKEMAKLNDKEKNSAFKKIMYKDTDCYDLLSKHGFKLELFPEDIT